MGDEPVLLRGGLVQEPVAPDDARLRVRQDDPLFSQLYPQKLKNIGQQDYYPYCQNNPYR